MKLNAIQINDIINQHKDNIDEYEETLINYFGGITTYDMLLNTYIKQQTYYNNSIEEIKDKLEEFVSMLVKEIYQY